MNESTSEILKRLAPEFVGLEEAERKSCPGPWRMATTGWECEDKPTFKFSVQYREGVFLKPEAIFVYEAKWSTRKLLDAHAKAVVRVEKAREALRFYAGALINYETAVRTLKEIGE